jgi:1-aminocyclopropane-1-carboxylate deaminase/D-cysteine desulfhydrase-like pyridoxal-dependent ACC family enzyme
MVVGFAADGRQRNVIGIDASCTPLQTKAQVLDIALKTSELVGGKTITAEDIVLNEELPGLRCALEEDRGGNSPVCAVGRHDH